MSFKLYVPFYLYLQNSSKNYIHTKKLNTKYTDLHHTYTHTKYTDLRTRTDTKNTQILTLNISFFSASSNSETHKHTKRFFSK